MMRLLFAGHQGLSPAPILPFCNLKFDPMNHPADKMHGFSRIKGKMRSRAGGQRLPERSRAQPREPAASAPAPLPHPGPVMR